ncbi:DUF779 domain-containing protein [Bacillus stercoris]|uniref:DUF779 domain-containing protein n=1 Tax=Bacillus stercoris TaxID=2054641 RepID=UPI003F764F6C
MIKIIATAAAKRLIKQLKEEHGKIVLIHSEGCCDGTSPVCTPEGDFYLGSQDEKIGEVIGVSYYMHKSNRPYWQHMQIVIDVADALGNTFSLESSYDKAFVIRSKKLDIEG